MGPTGQQEIKSIEGELKLKYFILGLGLAFAPLHADQIIRHPELPFEPAFAADQQNVTFDSLYQEVFQFQSMSNWYGVAGQISAKQLEGIPLAREYKHAQVLFKKHTISASKFERVKYNYEMNLNQVKSLKAQLAIAEAYAQMSRLSLIQNGNDNMDLRKSIAEAIKKSEEGRLENLKASVEGAILTRDYYRNLVERYKKLHKSLDLPTEEFDRMRARALEAAVSVGTIQSQISVSESALEGLNRTLERLFKEN